MNDDGLFGAPDECARKKIYQVHGYVIFQIMEPLIKFLMKNVVVIGVGKDV